MLEFRIAKDEKEIELCYYIRFKAYEDTGYVTIDDHPDMKISDEYDKHSILFLALKDKKGIGTIRVTPDSEEGFHMEHYCDLSELRKNSINLLESSKVVVLPEHRSNGFIMLGLANIVYSYMKKEKYTDLCFLATDEHAKMYSKIGIYPFSDAVKYPEYNIMLVPLHWNIAKTKEPYLSLFEKGKNIILD